MGRKKAVARPQKKSGRKVVRTISRDIIPVDNYGKVVAALVENAESQLTLLEQQGKIVEKFAYSFPGRNGQKIEGLTYWGLLACAEMKKKGGFRPEFGKPEYTSAGEKILLTVSVKNPKTGQIEWGTCAFDPRERFAERVAMTNAKRYALDKLISIPQKLAFLAYLKQKNPGSFLEIASPKKPAEVRKALNPAVDEGKDRAIKSVFAKINDLGLNTDATMAYYKKLYGYEHTTEFRVDELRAIWKELRAAEVDKAGVILNELRRKVENVKAEVK